MIPATRIREASERIRRIVRRTPTIWWFDEEDAGRRVWLKLESLQITGSFKVRGAANFLLGLSEEERDRGVVTCSSGNHGRAVSHVAGLLGVRAVVCVPRWVDATKLEAIRAGGARAVLHGETYEEAEAESYRLQREAGYVYVHPFDDPGIIAGQGTLGLELIEDLEELDAVVVPLSGGGLISGVAMAVKGIDPGIRVVGVSAANADAMLASLEAGRPVEVEEEPTLARALSGGLGRENRHTLTAVAELVDDHVVVSEEQIARAMAYAFRELGLVVEGGGAVGIAALLGGADDAVEGRVAVVVSGGNVEASTLMEVVDEHGVEEPR